MDFKWIELKINMTALVPRLTTFFCNKCNKQILEAKTFNCPHCGFDLFCKNKTLCKYYKTEGHIQTVRVGDEICIFCNNAKRAYRSYIKQKTNIILF